MTDSSTKKEEKREKTPQPAPLKNTLAEVLSRSDMQPAAKTAPTPKAEPNQPEKESAPKPFEVSEDTLKAIFNEKL